MNKGRLLLLFASILALSALSAIAQDRFYVTFRGTSWTADTSGKLVGHPVNDQSWLQDYAQTHGIQDSKSLIAVYHVNGDERGDVIEVMDKKSGTVLDSLYGLFFGQAYDRMALTSSDGSQVKVIQYVYNHQIDHSVGSALVTQQFPGTSGAKRTLIQGQMNYLVLPDSTHTTLQLVDGTFLATKSVPQTTTTQQTPNSPTTAGAP